MRTTLIALSLSLLAPALTLGQSLRVGAGGSYEVFRFRTPAVVNVESIELVTVPLTARARLSNAVAVEALSAWAVGRLVRSDGSESRLAGPTDTELRVLLGLGRGLVTITGIAQLPTGSSALSLEEVDVAGLIAADVLPFRISHWGAGGGFGLNAAVTRRLGEYAAGLSAGYVVARKFEPLDQDAFEYRPGNQLHIRAAVDRTIGTTGKAALVVSWLHSAEDEVDGNNLFRAAPRYEAVGSYAFALNSGAGIVYLGYLRRAGGEYLQVQRILPVEELLFAGTGVEVRVGAGKLRPRVDLRVLRREDGVGQGYTASLGADFEWPIGTLVVIPTARARVGNVLLREAAESAFTGFDIGLGLRFGAINP
ncbi:MAG: hypothetical protein ACRENP_09715 [Longimicrobiales bacterium]